MPEFNVRNLLLGKLFIFRRNPEYNYCIVHCYESYRFKNKIIRVLPLFTIGRNQTLFIKVYSSTLNVFFRAELTNVRPIGDNM